jgi:hypothetical protein
MLRLLFPEPIVFTLTVERERRGCAYRARVSVGQLVAGVNRSNGRVGVRKMGSRCPTQPLICRNHPSRWFQPAKNAAHHPSLYGIQQLVGANSSSPDWNRTVVQLLRGVVDLVPRASSVAADGGESSRR